MTYSFVGAARRRRRACPGCRVSHSTWRCASACASSPVGRDAALGRRDPVAAEVGRALLPRRLLVGAHRAPPARRCRVGVLAPALLDLVLVLGVVEAVEHVLCHESFTSFSMPAMVGSTDAICRASRSCSCRSHARWPRRACACARPRGRAPRAICGSPSPRSRSSRMRCRRTSASLVVVAVAVARRCATAAAGRCRRSAAACGSSCRRASRSPGSTSPRLPPLRRPSRSTRCIHARG